MTSGPSLESSVAHPQPPAWRGPWAQPDLRRPARGRTAPGRFGARRNHERFLERYWVSIILYATPLPCHHLPDHSENYSWLLPGCTLTCCVDNARSLWEVRAVSSQSRERGRAGATGVDSPPSCPQERPVGPRPPLGRFSPLPWLALSAPRNHAGAWNTGERRDVAFVPRGLLEGGGPRSNPTSPGSQASVSPA